MKKFICYILIFIFMITAAGCAAGQGDVTETYAETEEDTGSDVPTVGAAPSSSLDFNGFRLSTVGYAEIDGVEILSPFLLEAPDTILRETAKKLVMGLSGEIIAACTTSSPGVTFNTAKVTFKISEIKKGDKLLVLSKAGGSWNKLNVSVIKDEQVTVTLSGNGPLIFFKQG